MSTPERTVKSITPQEPRMPDMRAKNKSTVFAYVVNNPAFNPSSPYPGSRYMTPVKARIYWSKSGTVCYCQLWISSRDGMMHTRGHGSANGSGYCKVSTAIGEAINNAGIVLSKPCDGYGEAAAMDALSACARKAGWRAGDLMQF